MGLRDASRSALGSTGPKRHIRSFDGIAKAAHLRKPQLSAEFDQKRRELLVRVESRSWHAAEDHVECTDDLARTMVVNYRLGLGRSKEAGLLPGMGRPASKRGWPTARPFRETSLVDCSSFRYRRCTIPALGPARCRGPSDLETGHGTRSPLAKSWHLRFARSMGQRQYDPAARRLVIGPLSDSLLWVES